jgi:hypothetical protein
MIISRKQAILELIEYDINDIKSLKKKEMLSLISDLLSDRYYEYTNETLSDEYVEKIIG